MSITYHINFGGEPFVTDSYSEAQRADTILEWLRSLNLTNVPVEMVCKLICQGYGATRPDLFFDLFHEAAVESRGVPT